MSWRQGSLCLNVRLTWRVYLHGGGHVAGHEDRVSENTSILGSVHVLTQFLCNAARLPDFPKSQACGLNGPLSQENREKPVSSQEEFQSRHVHISLVMFPYSPDHKSSGTDWLRQYQETLVTAKPIDQPLFQENGLVCQLLAKCLLQWLSADDVGFVPFQSKAFQKTTATVKRRTCLQAMKMKLLLGGLVALLLAIVIVVIIIFAVPSSKTNNTNPEKEGRR